MKRLLVLALAFGLLVIGCRGEPGPTPDLVATQIAVEKAAHATMTAGAPAPTSTPANTPTAAETPRATATASTTRTLTPTSIWDLLTTCAVAWNTAVRISGEVPTASHTPTGTPTPTATDTVVPGATPTATGTPVPSPAMPPPTPVDLLSLRGKIVFFSENLEEPGLWFMDPNGENRRHLALDGLYSIQYAAAREQEALSPDGRYRVFVRDGNRGVPQISVVQPRHPEYGDLPPVQLTTLTGMCYDPVWSPDGNRIAFVRQENGSDDIWVIDASGRNARWLVRNGLEWDKHPSWSPDSQEIVFWSNRTGLKQLYVMAADGSDEG